jgi:hypothetical protein
MKEGLLESVRANAHWRVNIRPRPALGEKLSFKQCNEYVDQARVSIRGWDFPHVSRRNDEHGGVSIEGEFFENWCDWGAHVEFWRMYKSGQFLSYIALRENSPEYPEYKVPGGAISIVGTIYSVTEFFEFATRLSSTVPYPGGYDMTVGLRNVKGRQLSVGPNRFPFFDPRVTGAENIELKAAVDAVSPEAARELSFNMLLELFDHFGWNPDRSQIAGDQAKFLRRDF